MNLQQLNQRTLISIGLVTVGMLLMGDNAPLFARLAYGGLLIFWGLLLGLATYRNRGK